MGFFDDLFKRSTEVEEEISLGRFSDAYKPSAYQDIWEKSLLSYESERYVEALGLLLEFLKNNEGNNIRYHQSEQGINFELYQGSKILTGTMNEERFRAEVKVAKAGEMNIGLSRILLERNYLLKYSRYATDPENHILLIFDSYTVDASPHKLYQGLKEMAVQADKMDDLILDEFKDLEAINNDHIIERNEELKERQYQYLRKELKALFHEIEHGKLNIDQFPGGLSFLLLALNYKLDYLLTPEGFLMDLLEQNHRSYFGNSNREVGYRNNVFIKSFRKLMQREQEDIKAELYDVISTFGLPAPSSHETLVQLIQKELPNLQWYKENKHDAIALAIPSYIVGYSLFSYALPKPDMELLKLFYRVTESEYFGSSQFFNGKTLNARSIKKEVERIEERSKDIHPLLSIGVNELKFGSMVEFSESYLVMIKNMTLDGGDS